MMRAPDSPEALALFQGNLDLVRIIASQTVRSIHRGIDYADLESAGREGLLEAACRFDESRGVPFRAYANFRVRGAILDAVRKMSAMPRAAYKRLQAVEAATRVSEGELEHACAAPDAPSKEDAEQALDRHLAMMVTAAAIGLVSGGDSEAATESDPERDYERAELIALVRAEMETLDPHESEIIRRHYLEGTRLEDVARDLGMSKSWASRLHTRGIGRLTERLGSIV